MRKLVLAAEEEAANAAVRGNSHFLPGAAVPVTVNAAMDRGQKIALAVFVSSVILSAVVGFLCAYAFAHPGSSSCRNVFHFSKLFPFL